MRMYSCYVKQCILLIRGKIRCISDSAKSATVTEISPIPTVDKTQADFDATVRVNLERRQSSLVCTDSTTL